MSNVRLQHFEKNDLINNNIYTRNIPSAEIKMHFSPRSVSTKYSHLPILDHKSEATVSLKNNEDYSENIFFPGNRKPHYCGFASNVDSESTLRNQFFALQKSDQAQWFPSTNSDLYKHEVNFTNNNIALDSSLLFNQEVFDDFNPNISNNIGHNIFDNSTRVQLKNI